jgi:hypothetical protein
MMVMIWLNTTNALVTAFRTCIKHQQKIPHPEKESPCQGCCHETIKMTFRLLSAFKAQGRG